ncbi:barstar family protein [Streptomyces sp. NPDC007100]|uniref:barstar family protein n=1 Tax=Streptomyces sp. NPDC007100 TaxID=3155602 RepID=UPI0033E30B55
MSLHDERTWLGHCRDLSIVLPPDEDTEVPPIRLLGCAPSTALSTALATGTSHTSHPLRLDEAELQVLDSTGEGTSERHISVALITAWQPSALGDGLLDIDLSYGLWPQVPTWARPMWTRWITDPPTTRNLWAAYPTRERQMWLDIVRQRGCRLLARTPDRPPGGVYDLDGRHITDFPGLYCALGEAMNGPGGYFGGDLNALHDCLNGNFGATAPFTLNWHHSSVAHHHLSHCLSPDGKPYDFVEEVLSVLEGGRVEVVLK